MLFRLKNRRGFSLAELICSMVVMSLAMIAFSALTAATLRSYAKGSNQNFAFVDANRALEYVARDIRRSIVANIDSTGTRLTLTMPLVDTTTGYNKQPLQTDGHPINYYLGDKDGVAAPTGTLLWREVTGTSRRSLITAVAGAKFERTANPFGSNMNLIQVTLMAQRGAGIGQESRSFVTRASVRN